MKTHCINGHHINDESSYISANGFRRCRVCRRINEQKRRSTRLAAQAQDREQKRRERLERHLKQDQAVPRIIDELCAATASTEEFIFEDHRWQEVVRPRYVAFYAMRRLGLSYSHIGRIFGRDHSTVLHGVKQAERLVANDQRMARLLQRFEQVAA